MPRDLEPLALLDDLIGRAKAAGADAADAVFAEATTLSLAQRLGQPERLERSEGHDLGLRVLVGKRQAIVSSTDFNKPAALTELVERAVAMARAVPEDPYCGIADPAQLATSFPALDTVDPVEPPAATLIERARIGEEAALAIKGVTNSEGAEVGWSRSRVAIAASNGFAGTHEVTHHSLTVVVLAGDGTGMERDYEYTSAIHAADLEDPAAIGTRAGERAVRRLGPRKVPTSKVPIVFDPRAANGMLRHLAGAISGPSIARGTSFLKDQLGKQIFATSIRVIDDPMRRRGLRSHPFDGEGLAPIKRALIEDGVLTTWLLDLRSGRQLGLASTGHASRGTSSLPSPSPTNLYFEPGTISPTALMADIKAGLYVTEMMGMGVNGVTGDYSRGAAGFWIENGVPTYPVSEITIAGNLKDMFRNLTVANDLVFRSGVDSPTLRIDGMTIAGT
jgi:PmbA protein